MRLPRFAKLTILLPLEHKPVSISGAPAASAASKGGQARPWCRACADESLKASPVRGSALVTTHTNRCSPPTHQPDPATST